MRVWRIMTSTGAAASLLAVVTLAAGAAHAGPDVTVINTPSNPVPVVLQGAGGVSGTVDIGNTPNVKVVNEPTVQVGNTPGNPVPTLDATKSPANIVEIVATVPSGGAGTFAMQGPDGNVTPFTTVPSGKSLVITSGDFLAEHLTAPLINIQFGIVQNGAIPSARVWVVSGTMTTVLSWPPGIVIGPGQTLSIGAFGDDVIVRFRGYLVAQ